MRIRRVATAMSIGLLACLGFGAAGGAEASANRIAFASDRDDINPLPPLVFPISPGKNFDVYAMDADGSEQRRLTSAVGNDQFLAWSPDGGRIAFESDRDGDYDVYVMSADGSDVRQLTDHPLIDAVPAWSRDGRRIAFTSFRDGDPEIYAMNADGSHQKRITHSPGWDFVFGNWSPDGRILFNSDRHGAGPPVGLLPLRKFDIYSMEADGSDVRRLTNHPATDEAATWSPDGERITFNSDRDGNAEIYVMDADGSDQQRLTNSPAADLRPDWSPDGSHIAFDSDRDGDREVFVMTADGSSVTQVTHNSRYDFGARYAAAPVRGAVMSRS